MSGLICRICARELVPTGRRWEGRPQYQCPLCPGEIRERDALRMPAVIAAANAKRQSNFRDRQHAAGLVLVREWVHADDAPALKHKAVTLRKARGGRHGS